MPSDENFIESDTKPVQVIDPADPNSDVITLRSHLNLSLIMKEELTK